MPAAAIAHAKNIVAAILIQALSLAGIVTTAPATPASSYTQTEAAASEVNFEDQKYVNCLGSPVPLREYCARQLGKNLAEVASMTLTEKGQECMKLRPIYFRYCLEEIQMQP